MYYIKVFKVFITFEHFKEGNISQNLFEFLIKFRTFCIYRQSSVNNLI